METNAGKKMIVIEIIGGSELPMTKANKLPNPFVEVKVEKFSYKTKTVKGNTSPSWGRTFLIPNIQVSSMLSLRVFHDGGFFKKNDFLGGIERPISELLNHSRMKDRHVVVQLEALQDDKRDIHRGSLTLRFEEDIGAEASRVGPQALSSSSGISPPKILTVSDSSLKMPAIASLAQNVEAPIQTLIGSLNPIVEILNELTKIHPFASLAWAVVSSLYEIAKAQVVRDQSVVDLCNIMADAYSSAKRALELDRIPELKHIIHKMLLQTVECTIFVQEYLERGFGGRLLRDTISTKSAKIEDFKTAFSDLKKSFETELRLQIAFVSFRSADATDILVQYNYLNMLDPVQFDGDERPRCLPSTRLDVIHVISRWASSPSLEDKEKNVLWLRGFAGTWKSTLARTVRDYFRELNRLGASFFFEHGVKKKNNARVVVRTLAHQLAKFDRQIGKAVAAAVRDNPEIIDWSISKQFRKLIFEPLSSLDPHLATGPILIILDAFDECGIVNEENRKALLSVLAEESAKLPLSVRILVTSRPERDIAAAFDSPAHILSHELTTTSQSTINDLSLFIQASLSKINPKKPDWPGKEKVSQLVARAAGLFIWASTACEFVKGPKARDNYDRRLDRVLSNNAQFGAQETLDKLYSTVLDEFLCWNDKDLENDVKEYLSIVGIIVAAETPLSTNAITMLHMANDPPLIWEAEEVVDFVRPLSSLLSGTDDASKPLRPHHLSFKEFLTNDIRRTEPFFIDKKLHSGRLAKLCLNRMNKSLERHSSKLELCKLNSEVDLKAYLVQHAPEDLQYACRFWSDHLFDATDDSLYDSVSIFFFEHLLHWIELLSLMDALDGAVPALARADMWLKKTGKGDEKLTRLVYDGDRFIREFFDPISRSAGTVYRSALPFTPTATVLFETYKNERDISVIYGNKANWSSCLRTLEGHTSLTHSAVFLPDGTKLASASDDATVRLWDVETGKAIGSALEGHTDPVRSIAVSPDGKKLASASWDRTVRLWDVETRQPIGSALEGHTGMVHSVVFSPDGKKLASASADNMVRLWDVETGQSIGSALKGHTSYVNSVIFSPDDGKNLASASSDNTVRLWDVETGQPIGSPFEGRTVVFSPDGKKLALGSRDRTVRLLDVETRQAIGEALEGHTHEIYSVVFSPDGKKLASMSGGDDSMLRLWDVETGQAIGSALKGGRAVFSPDGKKLASASSNETLRLWDVETGQAIGYALHTDWVTSLVFSPDGKKLASASFDHTVRLWDVESTLGHTEPIESALEGRTGGVNTIVFSPDGKKLALGSRDSTVRLWDVESGQPIGSPLEGHDHVVSVVVFSPDGKKLASTSRDSTVRLWDVETGQPIGSPLEGLADGVVSAVFLPDGKKVAAASKGINWTVRLWDAETGQSIGSALKGHIWGVNSVVFSPDGKKVASVSRAAVASAGPRPSRGYTLRLWDAETGQPIGSALEGHTTWVNSYVYVTSVVFSPDGMKLASVSDDSMVRLWDVETGQSIGSALEGHTGEAEYESRNPLVVFSPDGKKLVSTFDNTVRLWDVESGQAIGAALEGHTGEVHSVVFSPDGKKLASASGGVDNTARLWNVETGQPIGSALEGHTSYVHSVVFSPDGKKLALSFDNTARLWDVETGQPIEFTLEGHPSNDVTDVLVVFSPDGKKFASASRDRMVQLWDVETGQPVGSALEHTSLVQSIDFSQDGKKLASALRNNTVQIWDLETGQPIGSAVEGGQPVFAPDGKKLASASRDRDWMVQLWDVETGQPTALECDPEHAVREWSLEPLPSSSFVDGFLECAGKGLLWFPHDLRGESPRCAEHFPVIAVGGSNGTVTLVRWLSS